MDERFFPFLLVPLRPHHHLPVFHSPAGARQKVQARFEAVHHSPGGLAVREVYDLRGVRQGVEVAVRVKQCGWRQLSPLQAQPREISIGSSKFTDTDTDELN